MSDDPPALGRSTQRERPRTMSEAHQPTSQERSAGFTRLHVSEFTVIDLERVPTVLGGHEAAWLGERVAGTAPDVRCFLGDLELHPQGVGPLLFRKSALVGLGPIRRTADGWLMPIEWRAASLAPLFPVFAGTLQLRPDRLELDGYYAPPGGELGQLADEALLRRAAGWTARWLIRRIAAQLH